MGYNVGEREKDEMVMGVGWGWRGGMAERRFGN